MFLCRKKSQKLPILGSFFVVFLVVVSGEFAAGGAVEVALFFGYQVMYVLPVRGFVFPFIVAEGGVIGFIWLRFDYSSVQGVFIVGGEGWVLSGGVGAEAGVGGGSLVFGFP